VTRKSIADNSRPAPEQLLAARDTTIPDVVAPGLRVLFAGINPGLYSAATGYHFAPRLFRPAEQRELLPLGLGITNVVARATASAAELTPAEIRDGGAALAAKVARLRPHWVAVVGITVYRTAFGHPGAQTGRQEETLAGARVWVLPNPSGLNASYQIGRLAAEFGRLRAAAFQPGKEER
jgi:TDG/mug DNA glycosylase family protein